MPIKNAKTQARKSQTRKLSDLNLPQIGSPLIVGDAQKTKTEDWFDSLAARYSMAFDILNAEHSHYQDKETCLFLVRSRDDGENYYFYLGANETRKAIVDAFVNDDTPITNVRFERIQTGQASPYIAIVDDADAIEGDDLPF